MITKSVNVPLIRVNGSVIPPKQYLEVLDLILGSFDPTQKGKKLPSAFYTDPYIYHAELQKIFGENWIAVGGRNQLPAPFSFFKEKIDTKPVVVLQDGDTTLRAIAGICRHNLYPVPKESHGELPQDKDGNRVLRCENHGWCYKPEGDVCYIPEPGKMPGITKEDLSLIKFEVDKWGPLVFVRMNKDENSPSLQTVLAPLIEQTANRDLSAFKWRKRVEYIFPCNWKLFIDNYNDGRYHVPVAHKALAKGLDYENYRTEVFEYMTLQHTPTKDANDSTSAVRSGEAQYWEGLNVMINLYQNTMDTNIVIPLGVNKCKVIFDFYSTDEVSIDTYADGAHTVQL